MHGILTLKWVEGLHCTSMLKISEFSRLAQVPVPTLRYYDQMGLLKPAQVDRFTEYRYYTVEQLPQLNSRKTLRPA